MNAYKELTSNDKETFIINVKTINVDFQPNTIKNNYHEEAVTNIGNNNNVSQANVDTNEVTSKDTLEHQNKDNDQENIIKTKQSKCTTE